MVETVPFKPEHLAAIRLQAVQASAQALMTVEHGRDLVAGVSVAYTVMRDGQPIACAGFIEIWKNRAYAWSYLSDDSIHGAKHIHRAAIDGLKSASARWKRIEMAVNVQHTAAKRWAAHLGFRFEGVNRCWTPDGRDVETWAKVN